MSASVIEDRGGPRLAGTRITVYAVLDYAKHNWHHSAIAAALGVSSDQVLAALKYIEEHKAEVEGAYQAILARHAQGNPPEIQKKLDAAHERFQAKLKARIQAVSKGE